MTTKEHLRTSAWWPTKPLATQEKFVGSAACGRCHDDILASQRTSQMARTLLPAPDSPVLKNHLQQAYRSGSYTYTLQSKEHAVAVDVADGAQMRTAVLQWALGSGDVGQSYLWQQYGVFHEARFNYFSSLAGFAATPGRLHGSPTSIDMALGRRTEDFEARTCFSCHSTTMSSASPLDVRTIVPGVSCEVCHGPGSDHVAAMQPQAEPTTGPRDRHIVNPARMTPTQACGRSHFRRTPTSGSILLSAMS